MKIAKNIINQGILQGILIGDVAYPNGKTAMFTLKVKDSINVPNKPDKKDPYSIQCIAFDKVAESLKGIQKGQLLFVRYHLTTSKRVNDEGVAKFFKNRIADEVLAGELLDGSQVIIPYLNMGVCQGEFVELSRMPEEEIAHVTIRVTENSSKPFTYYLQFTAYGPIINSVEKFYNAGDSICVKYKIETSTKKKQHYIDYVITDLI